jgi:hypothetical protein
MAKVELYDWRQHEKELYLCYTDFGKTKGCPLKAALNILNCFLNIIV